jgi:SsrA-binding protein
MKYASIFSMEFIRNKKFSFEYETLATYEAGIRLSGSEVKSVRAHHGSLSGAYVALFEGHLVLLGAHIPAWQEKNTPSSYDPYRTRTLLVHKKELSEIKKQLQTKGLTAIPVSLYSKGRYIKAQIAVAKGKKNFDKREVLKKKAVQRDMDRGLRD